VMYTAHFPRLHPSDFRVRSLDGVADDWPIDYDMLVPFFEENDRMMGVSGLAGDPGVPPRNPPLPLGRSGAMLAKAMNRLGWHWWPSDTTVATVDYEGRARCINLGHCTPACAQGAKASTGSEHARTHNCTYSTIQSALAVDSCFSRELDAADRRQTALTV
jgi:choline dehydrogenase-like flavoprotein